MKKTYYIIFSLGLLAIFLLQSLYIGSLYKNYLILEQQNIIESIYQAIDLELQHRIVSQKKSKIDVKYLTNAPSSESRITLDQLPEELGEMMRAYLSKIPRKQPQMLDIRKLMDDGVIRSKGDIETQEEQDRQRAQGNPINLHILDSLFDSRLNRNYKNKLCLLDKNEQIVHTKADSSKYNYTTPKFQIGLNAEQSIVASVDIKLSHFIKISITTLILSLIIVVISFLSLIYLITTLRRKDEKLKEREVSINGIIHDLKSPLVGVVAMLDLYHMLEQDDVKRKILSQNKQSVTFLCSKIERMLRTAKDRIKVVKEPISAVLLCERISVITEGIQKAHKNKKAIIKIDSNSFELVNIDVIHFDSIITNLVDNALKYSSDNVKIDVNIAEHHGELSITICDNGIGIHRKDYKKIFGYGYQCNENSAGGNGIGLSYVKAISRAHGGDIKLIHSEIGTGSTFKVTINIE